MAAQALIGPAIKALASGSFKKAALGAAKGAVKDKAKNFVTGKNRKGKGGALVKSDRSSEEQVEGDKGGAIVPTTPMVGSYKVETVPDKPDEVGKPSKISYETINNQLDSIIGLTNVLKKTSAAKIKNAENRRKAERKAAEKAKKRQRESLLEKGAGKALGMAGNLYGKATEGFDPIKFFTMIFLGNLFNWITNNGSKITAFLKTGLALFNNAGKLLRSGFKLLGKTFKAAFKLVGKLASPIIKLGKGIGKAIRGVGKKLGSAFGKIGKSLKNFVLGVIRRLGRLGALGKGLGKGLGKILSKVRPRMPGGPKPTLKPTPAPKPTPKPTLKPPTLKPPGGVNVPEPPKGNLAGGKPGSQLLKGGPGRSTNRIIAKLGGKNALKATKALKNTLGRIPVVGSLITALVSLLSGDPIEQALFKTGGAAIGGVLGSFIPVPVVGTLVGEIVGEYVGDLLYVLTKDGEGGGVDAVGDKLKEDWNNTIGNIVTAILGGSKKGPQRSDFPNTRAGSKAYQKARDEWRKQQELITMGGTGVTNMSTVKRDTKDAKFGDFIMASDGTLSVFDGLGTRGLKEGERELFDSGATNIDGTKQPKPTPTTSSSSVYGSAHLKDYAMKNGITDPTELAMFMAQMSHESGSFRYAEEIHDGSDYEGSSILGNNQPGDGPRFKGRGYIQLTGRWNYGHYGKMIGVDLVNNPQLAADPDVAAAIAIAYYMDRVDRGAARKGDVKSVTYAINGGYNGLKDRQRRFDLYMKGQTPEGDVKGSVASPQISSPSQSEGEPVIKPQNTNPSESLETSETATPAQVSPSTQSQSQMSNGITGLSQQLSYEETGSTVVMMQAPTGYLNGQQMPMTSGGGGTPIIMGSGDVVNSYYKSQALGLLYKG